jgi:hypothetical protein
MLKVFPVQRLRGLSAQLEVRLMHKINPTRVQSRKSVQQT